MIMKAQKKRVSRFGRFLREALQSVKDFERFVSGIFSLVDRLLTRLLFLALLIYHAYIVVHVLHGR